MISRFSSYFKTFCYLTVLFISNRSIYCTTWTSESSVLDLMCLFYFIESYVIVYFLLLKAMLLFNYLVKSYCSFYLIKNCVIVFFFNYCILISFMDFIYTLLSKRFITIIIIIALNFIRSLYKFTGWHMHITYMFI